MLVLTPKYGSQIDIDLLKKQKSKNQEPLPKHRNDIIYLTQCKDIKEAYLTFLDNKGKYFIGYKPKDVKEIKDFVKSLGEMDTLDVSWIDVSELDNLTYCFSNCQAKHIIGLLRWDVSNVIDMLGMFKECYKLNTIGDISGWDVSNVTDMDDMLAYCKNLESICHINEWDVSNVKNMNCMFFDCENLENIGDISGWDVSNVRDMRDMFWNCKKLESIGDLEKWNISGKVKINDMFKASTISPIPSWYTK